MPKIQDLCERMNTLTIDTNVFAGALGFVRLHSDESIDHSNKQLLEILIILEKEAKHIAEEMLAVELLAVQIERSQLALTEVQS